MSERAMKVAAEIYMRAITSSDVPAFERWCADILDAFGPEWRPIGEAAHLAGTEIIGSRWYDGKMMKQPFVTFWSPTLNKFYCDPTHWIPMIPAPPQEKSS